MFYNGLNWAIPISQRFYVQVYVCESVFRLLLLDFRAAWNLSTAQTHTKAFLTYLKISFTHTHTALAISVSFPEGLTHLPFLKSPECRRLCTVCHLPALTPPVTAFLRLSLHDDPPPSPSPPPAAPFWPPGTAPLTGRPGGERGDGKRRKEEERTNIGREKWLQVWINNHLSDECTCVCVTKQVQWPKTNMHGALQNVPWTVKRVSFGNNTHYKRAQPAGGLAEPIFFLPANSEVLSGIASNSSQRVMCTQLKWIYNK